MKRITLLVVGIVAISATAFAQAVIFEIKEDKCLVCSEPFEASNVIPINPSQKAHLDRLKAQGCDRLRDDRTKFSACVARAKIMLPGNTISFKLAPGAVLGQAIAQIQAMESRLRRVGCAYLCRRRRGAADRKRRRGQAGDRQGDGYAHRSRGA